MGGDHGLWDHSSVPTQQRRHGFAGGFEPDLDITSDRRDRSIECCRLRSLRLVAR